MENLVYAIEELIDAKRTAVESDRIDSARHRLAHELEVAIHSLASPVEHNHDQELK